MQATIELVLHVEGDAESLPVRRVVPERLGAGDGRAEFENQGSFADPAGSVDRCAVFRGLAVPPGVGGTPPTNQA